ncbi:MAG: aminotransferase class III-fold pyridoxal phosphate-dependent enzyme, partial [Actinocrinis sp.]
MPVDPAAILDRQRERESSARTYARHLPIVPVRAEGMTVYGADGRAYLDCLAGAGTLALGHNHPAAIAAIRRVLDSGAPLHVLDLATPIKDEFTDTLLGILPPDLAKDARVHFCGPSGADAVEAALKLARAATGNTGL